MRGGIGEYGCHYEQKNCDFVHPHICPNSWKYSKCTKQNCREYHLDGTHKPKIVNRDSKEESKQVEIKTKQTSKKPENQSKLKETEEKKPLYSDIVSGVTKNTSQNNENNHFLYIMLQQMQQTQNQMTAMMTMMQKGQFTQSQPQQFPTFQMIPKQIPQF